MRIQYIHSKHNIGLVLVISIYKVEFILTKVGVRTGQKVFEFVQSALVSHCHDWGPRGILVGDSGD